MNERHGLHIVYGLFSLLCFSESIFAFSGSTQTFITTAYYSPLPNQSYYLYGDYESEKKVQGEGRFGASGIPVHVGMIAAPKEYAFGTRIHLEGFGVGAVEDRGGAIVAKSSTGYAHDRLDVWVGEGEEGLKRALAWGKRTLSGNVIGVSSHTPSLSLLSLDTARVTFPKREQSQSGNTSSPYRLPSSTAHSVMNMLSSLGYNTNGSFSGVILSYQLDRGIVKTLSDPGAGVYGPKTRASLFADYDIFEKRNTESPLQESLIREQKSWNEKYERMKREIASFGDLKRGNTNESVRRLQRILGKMGYLRAKDTAIFGPQTEEALKRYQRARNITPTGWLDSDTKEKMVLDLVEE